MEFLQGAGASIFATLIVYVTRNTWANWWHLLLSKNYPQIGGRYRIRENVPSNYVQPWYPGEKQIMDLKQYGKSIRGSLEIYDNDDLKHRFPLSGTVGLDRSVLVKYESNDPKYTAKGSMLARFKGIESDFNGEHIFICLNCENIHTFPVNLEKLN
ncbi:hypothetical protein [Agarivorans sp. JK6]|uniref:hypothetical protein n=1 Tax=Agarivorans sp. JK6 TaxID=2997426 RepID=UPI00387371AD